MFYDPLCSKCRNIHNTFDLITEKYNKNINFALFDLKKNDVDFKITKIPSIFIWRHKDSKPFQYKKDLDFKNFTSYIEKKYKIKKEDL